MPNLEPLLSTANCKSYYHVFVMTDAFLKFAWLYVTSKAIYNESGNSGAPEEASSDILLYGLFQIEIKCLYLKRF